MDDDVLCALRRLVNDNPGLQADLFAVKDRDAFVETLLQLAQTLDYQADAERILLAMRHGRQAWGSRKHRQ